MAAASGCASFSVIIPALFEAKRVNALIDHVRMVGYGLDPEIIVVDGGPNRDVLAAIDRPGVVMIAAPRGRARQMNAGAEVARGDVLLFLHADARLPAGAFQAVSRAVAAGAAAGAFRLGIRAKGAIYRLIEAGTALRNRLTKIPYGDQAQFVRRDVFLAVGRFPDQPLMEDVELMRRIKRLAGRGRLALLPERTLVSARRWKADGPLSRLAANQLLLLRYLLGTPPERLAQKYPPCPAPPQAENAPAARRAPDADLGGTERPEPDDPGAKWKQ